MKNGQGFARRITRDNLSRFAALLKKPQRSRGGERDEDRANFAEPADPEASQAEAEFHGTSISVTLPFSRRTREPRGIGWRRRQRRQAPAGATQGSEFELIWESKPLTRRDLTIPDASGTHQTGSINLDKGRLAAEVDHRHYFRDEVFSGLTWTPTRGGAIVVATAAFQLVVRGINHGEFRLSISHTTSTTSRAYNQRNAMTRLRWGAIRSYIANEELIDRMLFLDRDVSDPARFRLRIE